jgi:hypothetical protein
MPLSQGPSALATLIALWFMAVARVCASWATSINRVCNPVPSATLHPIKKTFSPSVQMLPAEASTSRQVMQLQTRIPAMAGISARSTSHAPAMCPTTTPSAWALIMWLPCGMETPRLPAMLGIRLLTSKSRMPMTKPPRPTRRSRAGPGRWCRGGALPRRRRCEGMGHDRCP